VSNSHRTSTIPRPSEARDPSRPTAARNDDTRLIRRKRPRNLAALGGFVIVLALAAALFVLPLRAWLQQRTDLTSSAERLAQLEAANDQLQHENERLQTAEGIAEEARDKLGYQESDEQMVAALPPPAVPTRLPAGWPYSVVTNIVGVRVNEALAAAQSASAVEESPETATTVIPSFQPGSTTTP
jgi:cell division protein FtsB